MSAPSATARRAAATAAPGRPARTGAVLAAALAAPAAMGVSGPSLALPAAALQLDVSAASAAWLMTAYGLGMAVGTPLLSATAGRRGPGRMILAGGVLVAVGAAVVLLGSLPATPPLPLLIAGRAVEAVGAAGLNVAAFQLAGRDRSGRSSGVVAIGSATGGTLGLVVGAAISRAAGWPAALVLPLLSLTVLLPALRLAGPPEPAEAPAGAAGADAAGGPRRRPTAVLAPDVLRDRGFRLAAGLMLALATVNFALLYGAPRRVTALTGWSPVQTGAASSVAALTGALLSWQLVRTAAALGARRVRLLLAAGSLLAALTAAFAPWAVAVLLGSALSALVTAGGQGLLTGAATGRLPAHRQSLAIGLFNLAFLAGVAAGPVLAALVGPALLSPP